MNKKQRGITLIEAGLWVLLMSLSLLATAKLLAANRQQDLYHSEAQYMQKMQTMADSYMNQNRDAIEHMRSSADGILICNSTFNLCDISPSKLIISINVSTGDLNPTTANGANDVMGDPINGQSSYIRIIRTGIAPNYTFNGLIITDHSITHGGTSTQPANDMLGAVVQNLGLNGGISASDGNTYGYQNSWSTPMATWKFATCNGCLAYRFGDWAGDPSNAQYLPLDGSKAMQGAMSIGGFNIANVANVIATTGVVGHETGALESFSTVTGDVNAVRLDYIEQKNGQSPLGINIGSNLFLGTTNNSTTGTLPGIGLSDKAQSINLVGSSFYASTLATQNSCTYTVCASTDLNSLGTLNTLGNSTVVPTNFSNFKISNFDDYNNLTINAASTTGAALGSSFQTQQLTVDSNSEIDYFGFNKLSGITDATTNLIVNNLNIASSTPTSPTSLSTANIQTSKLETYAMGPNTAQGGTSYGYFTSPVYANMIMLKYANDATAFNKYGISTNINTAAATTTVLASGTGVAIATCPSGYYAYGGGPQTAKTTPGAGSGCTDTNDWAGGVKSQQQANYPVGITQWAVVCTYPGASPPQPIIANAQVLCYEPSPL